MAESKKTKKQKKKAFFPNEINISQVIRLLFLIFLALLLVYLYYLHTKGILIATIGMLWEKHQKMIEIILGITLYSAVIYYLGYQKGKKR